jgi:hypothetical protein
MYKGYRVKINGTEVPNMLVASGSYSYVREKRLVQAYTDGNGITHEEYYETTKALIGFALRQRNLEEQRSIKGIFAMQDTVSVEYWDDYDCEYKTGTFRMAAPKITHSKAVGSDILYNATQIVLGEV